MYFVHHAMLILARHHMELTMNVILEKFMPMDRYMRYSLSCWAQRAVACLPSPRAIQGKQQLLLLHPNVGGVLVPLGGSGHLRPGC